jgi:peptide/nickel transport system substrate-binding protein
VSNMQNKKLVMIITAFLMVTSTFAVLPALAAQPPIDTTTYYIGTIGQPRQCDPARAYDTASGEMIFNCYETLIFFASKPVVPATTTEITAQYIADLSQFAPQLATAMPTISADRLTWTFTIKSGIKFQPWVAANGTTISGQILTAADVEYTFERALVQDQSGAPTWMISLPLLGAMSPALISTNESVIGPLIDAAITSSGNTVTFHFAQSWPQTVMYQIFSQSWGGIVNKAFCIEHGCWNGTFYPGWRADYRRQPSSTYSPLDSYYAAKSKYSSASSVPAMCGTGPYKFTSWDKTTLTWREDRFDDYWGGWAGNHVNTIIEKGVAEWPTRKMQFLAGEFDLNAVPRANMYDLLDPTDPTAHTPIAGITLYYNAPALSNDVLFFEYTQDPSSPYVSKVPAGGTPTPDLFSNVHMRRAFCWALNFTSYLADAWFGEAVQPASWWVTGLAPDYENHTLEKFNENLANVEAELRAASFNGQSVWDTGFETYIPYNLGNDQRRIAAELIRDTIQSLNSKAGAGKFKVNVIGLDWPVILTDFEEFLLPTWMIGWLADFADADNFARPYMHSQGDFAYFQNYSDPHVDALIDGGILMADGPERNATYQELQLIYHQDAVSLPIMQAVGRRWQRDWVRGWYYNELYPGAYCYDIYKTVATPPQPVDVSSQGGSISAVGGTTLKVTPNGALMTPLTVTMGIHRVDTNNAVAAIFVIMALNRTNATGYSTIIGGADELVTLTLISPDFSTDLLWNETSVSGRVNSGTLNPGNYTLSGVVNVISSFAYDSNLANNIVVSGGGSVIVVRLTGDINNDGLVNILDISAAARAFGSKPGDARWNSVADVNADGVVNILDISIIARQFGQHV